MKTPPIPQVLSEAVAHHQSGDMERAGNLYRKILEAEPGHADALHLLGVIEHQQGRHQPAIELIRRALAANPGAAAFHNNLAECYRHLRQFEQAAQHYRRAIELDRSYVDPISNLGVALKAQGRLEEAVAHYRRALEINPDYASAHINLGTALRDLGQHDRALAHCRRAIELRPKSAEAHNNLANVLKDLGHTDEAIAHYRRAIELKPTYGQPYSNLAHSRRFGESEVGEVKAMEQRVAAGGLSRDSLSHLHFALGKACDDLGRYDDAFAHYRQANALVATRFDFERFTEYVDQVIQAYDSDLLSRRSDFGRASDLPVFIVGMPRSGTSLVEQILASHPQVFGAGELKNIALITEALPRTLNTATPYPQCIRELDRPQSQELADTYLDHLRQLGDGAERVVDKMMTNFLHLGLVALLLPSARIIHCRRNPLDTCLSCYFQDFSHRPGFAYDLDHLARYNGQYVRAMQHWRSVLPRPMLEVDYEQLTADQEGVSRSMIEYCGLDWDSRCLQFHRTRRVVQTASTWQVQQPMHTRSSGRWKKYQAHLQPLVEALERWSPSPPSGQSPP